jgi:hypothetical protein
MNVDIDNIFIHAHACKLAEPIQLPANDIQLFFKGEDNKCLVADSTQIDTNPRNYRFRSTITEDGYTDDYVLGFDDPMAGFGLNTFGIYVKDNANITHRYNLEYDQIPAIDLSVIIDNFHRVHNTKNYYLHICREPCNASKVGKRKPPKKKPLKNNTPKKKKSPPRNKTPRNTTQI